MGTKNGYKGKRYEGGKGKGRKQQFPGFLLHLFFP